MELDSLGSASGREAGEFISRVTQLDSFESVELLRSVVDSMSAGVVVLDKQRRVRMTNATLEAAAGLPVGGGMGKRCREVFQGISGNQPEHRCDDGDLCLSCGVHDLALEAMTRRQAQTREAVVEIDAVGGPHVVETRIQAAPFHFGGDELTLVVVENLGRVRALRQWVDEEGMCGMIGRHPRMLELFEMIRQVSQIEASVLVEGESGTGKEMVSSALHELSPRREQRMVAVNCGALSPGLLESELFGHVRGAFTGAFREKKGRFELAHRGTLFLDEVGELSENMQVKLLRVLQDGTFEPVGGEQTRSADVRLVCATNRNLEQEVAAKRFRADLYYRLSVVLINVPALRERREDIPLLTRHLLAKACEDFGIELPELTPEVAEMLAGFSWPGNVRQLENCLRHALVKAGGAVLKPEHLPHSIRMAQGPPPPPGASYRRRKLNREIVDLALRETGGNKVQAARSLGVSRATLYRFLAKQPTPDPRD